MEIHENTWKYIKITCRISTRWQLYNGLRKLYIIYDINPSSPTAQYFSTSYHILLRKPIFQVSLFYVLTIIEGNFVSKITNIFLAYSESVFSRINKVIFATKHFSSRKIVYPYLWICQQVPFLDTFVLVPYTAQRPCLTLHLCYTATAQ